MRALEELTAGQTIAERYRLIALRGTGGTGSVWRALHLPDQRECALKLLHRNSPERRAQQLERFLREAKAASSIDSPHAVRVLDFGVDGDVPFIAMELLEGETLASRLHAAGRLPPAEVSRIIDQIAAALGRAHELGIVHRDLKPENIFLAQGAQGAIAKVLDFGIAKLKDEEAAATDLTQTGALLGTPRYMSPEQIEGARHVDQRADLWALSVIAFECITGQQPFHGDGLRALFASICVQPPPVPSALCTVPRGFDAWFAKGAHRDAGKRFRTAAALAQALRRVCDAELGASATADESLPGTMASEVTPRRPRTPRRGPRVWLVLASAGVVVGLAGWIAARSFTAASRAESPRAAAVAAPSSVAASPTAAVPPVAVITPAPDHNPGPASEPSPSAEAPPASAAQVPQNARAEARHQPPARRMKRAPAAERRSGDTAWDVDAMLRDRK